MEGNAVMSVIKQFRIGAVIAISTFGVIVGTLYLVSLYQSWTPAYWVVAAILLPLVIYVLYADCGQNDNQLKAFLRFVIRLYWRHVVLAACLFAAAVVALIAALSTLQSAAKTETEKPVFFKAGRLTQTETEKFFGFMNSVTAPVQFLWGGLVLLWQVFVLLAVLFFEQVSNWVTGHPISSATVSTVLYLVWLAINVRKLWSEEFPRRSPTADGCAYSSAIASTGYWLK